MSINTDERHTPDELFNELDNEFHFVIDLASTDENRKCNQNFTLQNSALNQSWPRGNCFLNCPYSEIYIWMRKCLIEAEQGSTIICVLPCDTSTKWFHHWIWNKHFHRPRKGRIMRCPDKRYKFIDNPAKFATLIIIFNGKECIGE